MNNLVDALYARLLLRDIFGKIIPGAVVLFSISASLVGFEPTVTFLKEMPFWFWLLYLGASWIAIFAVQALGEDRLIRYHEKGITYEQSYEQRYKFDKCASEQERQQLERLFVIKEACGNGFLAIAFSTIVLVVGAFISYDKDYLCEILNQSWHVVLFSLGLVAFFVFFLYRMHHIHVKRQGDYMETIIEQCEKSLEDKKSST